MPSVRTIIPHKFFIFNHASLFSHCQIPVKQQLPVYYLEQIFILCAAYCAEPSVTYTWVWPFPLFKIMESIGGILTVKLL